MIEADLRGSDTHGVIRLPIYVKRRRRAASTATDIRVLQDRPAAALIDGDNAMGHLVMHLRRARHREGEECRRGLGRRAHEQSCRACGALCHDAGGAEHDRHLSGHGQQQPPSALGRAREPARHQPDCGRHSGAGGAHRPAGHGTYGRRVRQGAAQGAAQRGDARRLDDRRRRQAADGCQARRCRLSCCRSATTRAMA